MAKNLPYVNAYGSLKNLFDEIKKASVPTKFSQDYLSTVLGLKSSSYRAMIPLLKRLGFLDAANVPTAAYKRYRDDEHSGVVMGEQLREAYADLFASHEFANRLSKQDVLAKLKTITGAGEDDETMKYIAATFLELCKLATFDKSTAAKPKTGDQKAVDATAEESHHKPGKESSHTRLGLSYTINLNLPATTEVAVFNAIFKSLKEHILGD